MGVTNYLLIGMILQVVDHSTKGMDSMDPSSVEKDVAFVPKNKLPKTPC